LGNACYHSIQNILSSHLLSKDIKIRIYKTVILAVVLYGCESWSLTLGEQRLEAFENVLLRRIFGPKRKEIIEGWSFITSTLHHSSPSIIRMTKSSRMSWTRHVACMEAERNTCMILMGRP
jgi:hypothetical protein